MILEHWAWIGSQNCCCLIRNRTGGLASYLGYVLVNIEKLHSDMCVGGVECCQLNSNLWQPYELVEKNMSPEAP